MNESVNLCGVIKLYKQRYQEMVAGMKLKSQTCGRSV